MLDSHVTMHVSGASAIFDMDNERGGQVGHRAWSHHRHLPTSSCRRVATCLLVTIDGFALQWDRIPGNLSHKSGCDTAGIASRPTKAGFAVSGAFPCNHFRVQAFEDVLLQMSDLFYRHLG